LYRGKLKGFSWPLYLAGYAAVFLLLFAIGGRHLLFILFVFLYAGMYHKPALLAYFFIFLFSITVCTGYWAAFLVVSSFFFWVFSDVYRRRRSGFEFGMFFGGFSLLALVLFPAIHLVFRSTPQTLLAAFTPELKSALEVSILTASVSTLIIFLFGVPLAYCMARMEFRGKAVMDALIDFPIFVPQTAAGIALLVLLGPKTPLGGFFNARFGIQFAGSIAGIVACQVFVSMPFLVRSAIIAFEGVNPKLENVSRSLGAGPLRTFSGVSFPLAFAGIFNGCALSFCRALSEAGSLMIVAYRPASVPMYINDVFVQYGIKEAVPVGIVFVVMFLWGFIALKWFYEVRKKSSVRV
jgi:molybdate/tungstate transport system permease protein